MATLHRKPAFARTSDEKFLTNQCEIFSWVLSNSASMCSTYSEHRMLSDVDTLLNIMVSGPTSFEAVIQVHAGFGI
jgi:hypothetical protein